MLFDFEQPFFIEELPQTCKDHSLVRHDGVYHLFFTEQNVGHTWHTTNTSMMEGWDLNDGFFIDISNAPEISDLGDETIFSRHTSNFSILGNFSIFQFDHIIQESGKNTAEMTKRLWDVSSNIGEEMLFVVADMSFEESVGCINVDTIQEYEETGVDTLWAYEPASTTRSRPA